MTLKTTTAITAVTFALASPLAAATESGGTSSNAQAGAQSQTASADVLCETGFLTSDSDGDGTITRQEYDQSQEMSFKAMDANDDGKVTMDEYVGCLNVTAGMKQGVEGHKVGDDGEQSASADQSSEGDTAAPFDSAMMDDIDENKDEAISPREYMGATHDAYQEAQATDDETATVILRRYIFVPAGMSSADVRSMGPEETAARASQRFETLDTDRSGDISKQEWSNAEALKNDLTEVLNARFEELDADASGDVSMDEYYKAGSESWEAAQNAMKAEGMAGESGEQAETGGTLSAERTATPEKDGTRGSAGDANPPVIYFRYFAPLDAG